MIKNIFKMQKFYRELERRESISHKEAFRIYDALHKEAASLGAMTSENIFEGFDAVLRVAHAVNCLKR